MIDLYPNAEQILFIRDLFYREQIASETLLDSEKELILKLRPLLQGVEKQCEKIVNLVENELSQEIIEQAREELDPFNRSGAIFLDAGYFSEYGSNRLHERLQDILILVNNFQKGQLEDKALVQDELQGFLIKLAEKLGVTGITFENPQNNV